MISLLFLLATAQAADVYELCSIKRQKWSERQQRFEQESVTTFYSREKIQFILYKNSFEMSRDRHPIIETTEKNGMTCWREHANSELCYDKDRNQMVWEWNTRAGATWRDVMDICGINGE